MLGCVWPLSDMPQHHSAKDRNSGRRFSSPVAHHRWLVQWSGHSETSISGMQSIMCDLLGLLMAPARITKNFDPLMSDSSTTTKICFSFRIALTRAVSSFTNVVSFSRVEDSLGRGCLIIEKRFLKSGFLNFFRGIFSDRKTRTTSLAKSLPLPLGKELLSCYWWSRLQLAVSNT